VDIEFRASAAFNFINCYTLGAANISDGCMWVRNYLRTADTGQLALCITAAAHNDLKFYDNYVVHAAAAAGLLTAGAADLLGLDVRRNFVQTGQTDGTVGVLVITTSTASSGSIVENDMKTADASANVAIPIASKVYAAKNYIAGADEVGTVIAVGTLFDNT
jgi:Zn-dependent alcohol dehydrogenase